MSNAKIDYIRIKSSFVSAIDIAHDLDGDGIPGALAEWVHLPGTAGDTITIQDGSGTAVTLTSTDQITTWRIKIRKITAASGAFQFGTGEGPAGQGAKGDQGMQGDQGLAGYAGFFLPIVTPIAAGVDLGLIRLLTNDTTNPITLVAGGFSFIPVGFGVVLTADNTHYLTVTALIRDGVGNPTVIATCITKITAGFGNWTGNGGGARVVIPYLSGTPVIQNGGGTLEIKTSHSGSGVILPAGTFEFRSL